MWLSVFFTMYIVFMSGYSFVSETVAGIPLLDMESSAQYKHVDCGVPLGIRIMSTVVCHSTLELCQL